MAELLGAPVFEFWMPMYMNFPRNHPLHGEGPVEEILGDADCILIAGCDAPWHPPLISLQNTCEVIVMEEDPLRPRSPYWGYKTDYCIAGDVGANLAGLYNCLKKAVKKSPQALKLIGKRAKHWKEYNEVKRNGGWRKLKRLIPSSISTLPGYFEF